MYQHSVSEKKTPWITKPTLLLAGRPWQDPLHLDGKEQNQKDERGDDGFAPA
jgi:hypothetical protein